MTKDWFPTIDSGRCKKDCYICINFCPHKVYAKEKNITLVSKPDKCISGCNNCKKICPEKAISFISARQIEIDGMKIGINGLDDAFSKYPDNFDAAYEEIKKHNYIPKDIENKFREAVRMEFDR